MFKGDQKPNETARDYAFRILRENIVSLELKPGAAVSEKELADDLGISRTPVREALIELSKMRVVEIFPQKKSKIALIDLELVEEARFTREILEKEVTVLACDFVKDKDLWELEAHIKLQEFYLKNNENDKLLQLDYDFHNKIFHICKKDITYTLIRGMSIHFDRALNLGMTTLKDDRIISEHWDILDALRLRDKNKVREVIERHQSRVNIVGEEIKSLYPHYFKLESTKIL